MIIDALSSRKAVSALLTGMAFCFLFTSCTLMAVSESQQKKSSANTYSEADLAFLTGRYKDALDYFKAFIRDYPDYPEVVAAKYKIACVYFNMGDYQNSIIASREWINIYPNNPLKIDVMSLLGENYNALGNRTESFKWLFTAVNSDTGDDFKNIKEDLDSRLIDLINACSEEELEEISVYSSNSYYSPYIYHRLALISFDEDRTDDAKEYAMQLVRSSQEETWVSIGRELLERISSKNIIDNDGIITIGCLLPLSGPFALYGQEMLNGIELGMDIFSRVTEGRPIELVIKDTKGDAEETVTLLNELVEDDNITTIVGPLASGESTAAAKKAQELGVPIITFTQKEGITDEGDMVFRNFLTPSKEVEALLNRAVNEMGMTKFAVLYPDKTYGRYMKDVFCEKAVLIGGTVTAVESYDPEQTDFAETIKNLVGAEFFETYSSSEEEEDKFYDMMNRNSETLDYEMFENQGIDEDQEIDEDQDMDELPVLDFEAVFIPDNYEQISLIAPQFPFYGIFNVPFLGTSLWMSEDLIKSSGGFVQGAIFPVGFVPYADTEGIEKFFDDYEDSFQSEPGDLAANGYDTIRLIKDIINNGDIRTRKDFQGELYNNVFSGVTGRISFDEKGEVTKAPVILKIEGSNFKVVD